MSTHCIFRLETTHISWLLDAFLHLQSQQWPLRSVESEKWKCQSLRSVRLFVIPWTVGCQVPPWHSPGENTGMGSHSIHQRVFLTQGSNPGLLHCRQILYHLSHQGYSSHYFLLGGNLHSFTVGLFPSSSKSAMAALVLYTHLHVCGSLSDYS